MSKNIILLSDGTGNSSAKPFKTNVWRLYQALDTVPPADPDVASQIVFYDNGVGTENFKPLALLGGALGFGVWKNVRDLYTFVCRNYEIGDQIYAFGFSRGAFTVRLLMGLIGKCGIVQAKAHTEAKLLEAVQMAYEAFRRDFLLRASKQRGMIYHFFLSPPPHMTDENGNETPFIQLPEAETIQTFVDIAFLGVWDTVDAYGMPVDELKLAIDRWVWPMSFADRDLSPRICKARHALSLDDERPTFRPVLWNEIAKDPNDPKNEIPLSADRIQQVWFSGVHSNVGGGYADDGLAYVTLDWMMNEAELSGLRFARVAREEARWRANPHGEQYDSRSGIAGYYRYGPRKVRELCEDTEHGVKVVCVNVHPAVFERIERHQVEYAPVSLDRPFDVLGGQVLGGQGQKPDHKALEAAWDVVWWRRLAYFATVGLTFFVGLFILRLVWSGADRLLRAVEDPLHTVWSFVTGPLNLLLAGAAGGLGSALRRVKDAVLDLLPGWLSPLLDSFAVYPLTAVLSLGLLAWLFFRKSEDLQDRVKARAEWAWAGQKALDAQYAPKPSWLNRVARHGRVVTATVWRYCRSFIVHVLGISIGLLALPLLILFGLWRMLFKQRKWLARARPAPRRYVPRVDAGVSGAPAHAVPAEGPRMN